MMMSPVRGDICLIVSARTISNLVFSTKDRRRTISEAMQPEMWAYLAGICRNEKMVSVAIGGIEDHVHLLFHLPPTISLSKAVSVLKANSSRWMNERGIKFRLAGRLRSIQR